ncbi:phosphatase [Thermobrachium celere]|uniref:Dihydroxyacetone kinase family protein n=2 Tax=Thermobrachium TaxID=150333 RepID=R7RPA7_9CLOT|nr:phosphatase [Thermobrachium celere]CDF57899.1 Dihydroxyacetone kinase family protein [Thermobrachium celere DSM 8682]
MKVNIIDGHILKNMIISGAYELERNKEMVNKLNVFPVPDGDTGTNMSATMMSAITELNKIKEETVKAVVDAASMGTLMGARGNSGVILSQLIRGFAKYLKDKNQINTKDFALALKEGVATAYKAVMKPTEGTILTVSRESAEKAIEFAKHTSDFEEFLHKLCIAAEESLNKTPNILPALKQANVVDAGGMGLLIIYKGMLNYIKLGKIEELKELEVQKEQDVPAQALLNTEDIKFAYCTEFFIKTKGANPDDFKHKIENYGDSMVVVGTEELIKVHIHTNNPGIILEEALKIGELMKIKIDNMKEQHRHIVEEETTNEVELEENTSQEEKEYGIVTVAMGDGITNIFKDLGVDFVIEGGQTMNPSTQDILAAVNKINARNIFVLPNNSNIILAAEQAKELSDKNVFVVPTKSIPQGITALVSFDYDAKPEENYETLCEVIKGVKTGQVTFAVRDTVFNDVEVKEGNKIAIANGKLIKASEDLEEITLSLIDELVDDESQLITIFYGNGVSEEEAQELQNKLEEKYKDVDITIYYGGQPLYYYLISVE